jgi:hypothetical protein
MIGRTGFGPLHASDRTISRRCSAENCKRVAWQLIPNKPAASEYRQDFAGGTLPCRCNDIHVTRMFCRRAIGISCVAAESRAEVCHHGGNTALSRYISVLTSGKQGLRKTDASIRRRVNWRVLHLDQLFSATFGRAQRHPYRLLTCLNELVTWHRSQVRPSAPPCTSSCW